MRPTRSAVVLAAVLAFASLFSPLATGSAQAVASTVAPTGTNNWSCRVTAAHPNPVVLVHGTYGDMTVWNTMGPALANAGYCTFALNYGSQGTTSMVSSASELKTFVDKVLAST